MRIEEVEEEEKSFLFSPFSGEELKEEEKLEEGEKSFSFSPFSCEELKEEEKLEEEEKSSCCSLLSQVFCFDVETIRILFLEV